MYKIIITIFSFSGLLYSEINYGNLFIDYVNSEKVISSEKVSNLMESQFEKSIHSSGGYFEEKAIKMAMEAMPSLLLKSVSYSSSIINKKEMEDGETLSIFPNLNLKKELKKYRKYRKNKKITPDLLIPGDGYNLFIENGEFYYTCKNKSYRKRIERILGDFTSQCNLNKFILNNFQRISTSNIHSEIENSCMVYDNVLESLIPESLSMMTYELIQKVLFQRNIDLDSLIQMNHPLFKLNLPSTFTNSMKSIKPLVSELDEIFNHELTKSLNQFLLPYKITKFVQTGTDYDDSMYGMYRSSGVDPGLAKMWSKVNTGHVDTSIINRRAEIKISNSITPSWSEIKSFYGGLKGLMEKGVTQKDTLQFKLTYKIDKFEFYHDSTTGLNHSAMFITMNTSETGKIFHQEKLKDGYQIKVIGTIDIDNSPFHISHEFDKYKKEKITSLNFVCKYPENPINKEVFQLSIYDFKNSGEFVSEYKKLHTIYWDELRSILGDVPYISVSDKKKINFIIVE